MTLAFARHLPRNVTSYDLLKTFAIVLMFIDHVGYYFYNEEHWMRIIGRGCAPILFFLAGYARTRELEPRLWLALAIMEVGRFMAGMPILPANIAATFLLIRMMIDRLMLYVTAKPENFWQINGCMILLVLPTYFLFEYGAHGFYFAMLGWLVRKHYEGSPLTSRDRINAQFLFTVSVYIFWETVTFLFSRFEMFALSAWIVPIIWTATYFRPLEFPALNARYLIPVKALLQFCGRWSLEIYVVHVMVFQAIATFTDPARFPAFHFMLLPK